MDSGAYCGRPTSEKPGGYERKAGRSAGDHLAGAGRGQVRPPHAAMRCSRRACSPRSGCSSTTGRPTTRRRSSRHTPQSTRGSASSAATIGGSGNSDPVSSPHSSFGRERLVEPGLQVHCQAGRRHVVHAAVPRGHAGKARVRPKARGRVRQGVPAGT